MARAFASNDTQRVRQAIATGLFYTVIISAVLAVGCIIVGAFTPIIPLLERTSFHGHATGYALWVVALGSCAAFTLNFINMVYAAEQRAAALSYFSAASSILFLGLVYWWPLRMFDHLTQISSLYLISIAAANLSLVLWYFRDRLNIIPTVKDIQPEMRQRILGFGVRIFIIQIAAMAVFTTARILVSIFLDVSAVVVYDAAFKLFMVITMLHTLLMSTFWSSFTEAHAVGDWEWLRGRMKLLQLLIIPIFLASLFLAYVSPWIIRHWMTQDQVGPISLYVSFALLTSLSAWSNVFAYFLNGIGDTKVQMRTSLIALAAHFPCCYLFTKVFGLGLTGINLGTIVSVTFFAVAGPIYVWQLLRKDPKSTVIRLDTPSRTLPTSTIDSQLRRMEGGSRLMAHKPSPVTTCLTIVTVVYNDVERLITSFNSVSALRRNDISYIVVDGGSTDRTLEFLQANNENLDYWLSEPDQGIYSAMNKAVKLATAGTYILFLGAGDCVLHLPDADTFDRAKSSGVNLLFGDVLIGKSLFSSTFNRKLRYRNTLHHQGMFLLNGSTSEPWFDEGLRVFADWDLNLSLFQRGVVAKKLGYTVAFAEPGGVSASLHLSEIIRMINRRCGPLSALAAAIYHGALQILR